MKNVVQKSYFEEHITDDSEVRVSIEVHGCEIVATKKILDHLVEELMKNIQLLQTIYKEV